MSKQSENLSNVDDEDERLDNEFREQNKLEVDGIIKEDNMIRGSVNTFTDIRSYLERTGLKGEICHNISVEFIKDNLF